MIRVVDARHIDDYKISIEFNDGSTGIIDLKEVIFNDKRKIFKELRDINRFKSFKLDMDTIVWENGLDLAPEYLYKLVNDKQQLSVPKFS